MGLVDGKDLNIVEARNEGSLKSSCEEIKLSDMEGNTDRSSNKQTSRNKSSKSSK